MKFLGVASLPGLKQFQICFWLMFLWVALLHVYGKWMFLWWFCSPIPYTQATNLPLGSMALAFTAGSPLSGCLRVQLGNVTTVYGKWMFFWWFCSTFPYTQATNLLMDDMPPAFTASSLLSNHGRVPLGNITTGRRLDARRWLPPEVRWRCYRRPVNAPLVVCVSHSHLVLFLLVQDLARLAILSKISLESINIFLTCTGKLYRNTLDM